MLVTSQELGYDKPTKERTEAPNQITGLWEELGVGITPDSGSLFAMFLAVTRDNVASSSYEKHGTAADNIRGGADHAHWDFLQPRWL